MYKAFKYRLSPTEDQSQLADFVASRNILADGQSVLVRQQGGSSYAFGA